MKRIVIRAESMGFCMGVRMAIKMTEETILSSNIEKPIYTLGPLIHNEIVLADLKRRGVGIAYSPEEISDGTVIIRAHGVGKKILDELVEKNLNIINATCSRVKRSQDIAMEYSLKGYAVIIVGDRDHGEVTGIKGYASDVIIVSNIEEAEKIEVPEKAIAISQTTFKRSEYESIASILKEKNSNLEIADTICPATQKRQNALLDLCNIADAILVIGGKQSANTIRLLDTALRQNKPAWHIEDENDIPESIFKFNKIGITAGASTPDWIIDRVEKEILTK